MSPLYEVSVQMFYTFIVLRLKCNLPTMKWSGLKISWNLDFENLLAHIFHNTKKHTSFP